MDELKKQVDRAQRRLTWQRFQNALVRSLLVSLAIAIIGCLIPKVWPLGIDPMTWMWSWLGGAAAMGVVSAVLWTWLTHDSRLEAAIEIDRRFGLKERVSSTLALSDRELDTEAGQALVADASRRVAQVEVADQFRAPARLWNMTPLLPAATIFLVAVFVPDAVAKKKPTANASTEAKQRVERAAENLKKKLAERKKNAEEMGLDEASDMFSKLEKGTDDIRKLENLDRKKALVKLNNLADEIKQRRNQLGGADEMRKQLNQLRDLKDGPAKRMSQALKNGELKKALAELNQLTNKLSTGKLSNEQQKQLAEQLKQMADKLSQMAQAHDMAKQDLQKQIERLKAAGDRQAAGKLQNRLDKLNQQNEQMKRLQRLAQQMAQASQSMGEGKTQEATNQMNAMAAELSEMQMDASEMAMLEAALAELEASKESMNCSSCQGAGCNECQGNLGGQTPGRGQGMGQGRGQGDRPESATAEQFYDSKIKGKVGRGKAVVVGEAGGPNRPGQALEEVKQAIRSATIDDEDPLTNARLPKDHLEQARKYFEALREGE